MCMHVCVGVCVCVRVSAASPAMSADVTSSQDILVSQGHTSGIPTRAMLHS